MQNTNNLSPELFQPANISESEQQHLARERVGFWKDAWRRFRKNIGAMIGLSLIILILMMAIFVPIFSQYDYQTHDQPNANQEESSEHYFGTDAFGRDLWTRTWYGARISLLIAFLAAFIDLVVGVTYGSISGYFGGRLDNIMQRIIEILYGIPSLIVIILMLLIFEPGIIPIAVAMSVTGWIGMARIVRAQVLKLKSQEYVLAARTLGASNARIMVRHLIPNVMGSIIIAVTFTIPSAIFFEAFLSFIGLGIQVPEASLGSLVNEGSRLMQVFPYQLVYPATILSVIMLSFNLVGDGLRDALDPRMRK